MNAGAATPAKKAMARPVCAQWPKNQSADESDDPQSHSPAVEGGLLNLGRLQLPVSALRAPACLLLAFFCASALPAQRIPVGPQYAPAGTIPLINVGGNAQEAQFARLDFAQMTLEQQRRQTKEKEAQQKLVADGTVSALDLAAPAKAVNEFNRAAELLRKQKSKEAIPHLEKAIATYPKFVSAHNDLGLAYLDQEDKERARTEFEAAAKLDGKFPISFVNLGRLALLQNDFALAESQLQQAATLRPRDAGVLTALAYAQHGAHEYRHAIETVARVHALDHKGSGNVHYVAAAAALAIKDFGAAERELALFLQEDPANPLAPVARHDLDVLSGYDKMVTEASVAAAPQPTGPPADGVRTFPNSERLNSQLVALGDDAEDDTCDDCGIATEAASPGAPAAAAADVSKRPPGRWTIRKDVDEVALFFSVTAHGKTVDDLQAGDITILDNDKPPLKVLSFTPQSKLPLRLALVIDTSGSVQQRFSFEKKAATKFLQEMLRNPSDLGFVEGFADSPAVVQDFTADRDLLAAGINNLANRGGTALFDAVSLACWKLGAYPERERVARVLVVVSDGEDNSSHRTLKQAIHDAEATGVTVYTISTKVGGGLKTDADRVLEALAERSGGEALFPGDMFVLGKAFNKLRDMIRSRYLLAYKPADFQPNGGYRTISVSAKKGGEHLQVHARKGYHARLQANP